MKPCDECGKEETHLLTSGVLLLCDDCYHHHDEDPD